MKLVIGGCWQGKTEYASERYHIGKEEWMDGKTCEAESLFHAKAMRNFHEYIKNRMEEGKDVTGLAEKLIKENSQIILVTDEVGYGIVPLEKKDREWREQCGRICTKLAQDSEEVIRVCCGIGTLLKNKEKE